MDTRLLRAFITLADTANYREAASRLCISQPALTKQIKLLENQLGIILFQRGRHGAVLTESGQALLPYAKQAINQIMELLNQAIALGEKPPLSLNVGFGISTFQEASFFVARLREKLPNIAIQLDDMPSHEMEKQLQEHQLHIAFTRHLDTAATKTLTSQKLKQEVLALAIAQGHQKKNTINDYLAQYPLLTLRAQRGLGLYQQIQRYLQSEGVKITPLQEANDIQTLIALVAAKVGVSLVPYSARHISQEDICFIPIQHHKQAQWQIDVVWQSSLPKAWQTVIYALIDEVHKEFTDNNNSVIPIY
ncbi:LysR family transcriptional regulator [Providencia sp. PROV110]|uniref:LysR family transcriptional regulator n=1 Tax=Providencia sp. PROV110 TaxID=2949821 RepID=UPI00234BDF12|nr:LysR family transcriptional regulator [Providencia sp. PROV110]